MASEPRKRIVYPSRNSRRFRPMILMLMAKTRPKPRKIETNPEKFLPRSAASWPKSDQVPGVTAQGLRVLPAQKKPTERKMTIIPSQMAQ